jgi:hypothetical protein
MKTPEPTARAARLERLLVELSFSNRRRNPDLLAEIGRLLDEALEQGDLAPGSTPAEVRRAIGPPSLRRGDETDSSFDWGYPRPAPAGRPAGDDWYLFLRFRDGALHAIETRIWREGR